MDFLSATLQQPSTAGVCTSMQLIIVSGSSSQSFTTNPPQLCGTLTGQHRKYKRVHTKEKAQELSLTNGSISKHSASPY